MGFCDIFFLSCLRIGDPVSPDQEAMTVDTVRGTGDECRQILSADGFQGVQLARFDGLDLIDFVGKDLTQNVIIEMVPFLELVQVGEHDCGRQSAMRGND